MTDPPVVFHRACQAELVVRVNPLDSVDSRKVPRGRYVTLQEDEVELVLRHVPRAWRGEFATAIYAGLRKGEILGLRKICVDLKRRVLPVKWSYDKDTTKGGHEDEVPLADALMPYLETAVARSPSDRVSPVGTGSCARTRPTRRRSSDVRSAAPGSSRGYDHVCRRCKARGRTNHTTRHADPELRRCETCGMKLWPRALPRPLRFHDLRHSTTTALLAKGTPPHIIQRILRHASVATTTAIYGHLQAEDVRAAVNTIAPPSKKPARVTGELQQRPQPKEERPGSQLRSRFPALVSGRCLFEPATPAA